MKLNPTREHVAHRRLPFRKHDVWCSVAKVANETSLWNRNGSKVFNVANGRRLPAPPFVSNVPRSFPCDGRTCFNCELETRRGCVTQDERGGGGRAKIHDVARDGGEKFESSTFPLGRDIIVAIRRECFAPGKWKYSGSWQGIRALIAENFYEKCRPARDTLQFY